MKQEMSSGSKHRLLLKTTTCEVIQKITDEILHRFSLRPKI